MRLTTAGLERYERAGLGEYALAAGLVAVAAVACMPTLSTTVSTVFTKIASIINTNVH